MRRHNFQTVSWFHDLWTRKLLDLDPPYQRRSVWTQHFKDYFVDTVLLNYPAPALFVFEDIAADGRSLYHVVDGKQRLTALFEFIRGAFPVSESSDCTHLRGSYFGSMPDDVKKLFWGYQFLVEYIPSSDEKIINAIFDRINRNVSKLTAQELRHARLDGVFINAAESLSEWMTETLPKNFPRFTYVARQQMKEVELVAILLLLAEEGPKGYSQDGLDEAFASRDDAWEHRSVVESAFRNAIQIIRDILKASVDRGGDLSTSRLRNQADFYSLVGAVYELSRDGLMCSADEAANRLARFLSTVDDELSRVDSPDATLYYDAARSASNDRGPRETRISIVRKSLIDGST